MDHFLPIQPCSEVSVFNLCYNSSSVLSPLSLRELLMHRVFCSDWKIIQWYKVHLHVGSHSKTIYWSPYPEMFKEKKLSKTCKNYIKKSINIYFYTLEKRVLSPPLLWWSMVLCAHHGGSKRLLANYHVCTILWPPGCLVNKPVSWSLIAFWTWNKCFNYSSGSYLPPSLHSVCPSITLSPCVTQQIRNSVPFPCCIEGKFPRAKFSGSQAQHESCLHGGRMSHLELVVI